MKFLIGRYDKGIKRSINMGSEWHLDWEAFYTNLQEILKEKEIPYEFFQPTPRNIYKRENCISLCYHSYGNASNVWHMHKGYVPGYLYFDKTGYSAWSEAVKNYNNKQYSKEKLQETQYINRYYINNNISVVKQPDITKLPNKPYILVLGQQPGDSVAKHAYIQTVELSKLVNKVYKNSKFKVYTKPHPSSRGKIKFFGEHIEGSIHKLIKHAEVIYTVNSGTGFQALLHEKTVFTSGNSDYSPATIMVKNIKDIENTKDQRISSSKILNYLTYCFNDHFVNAYSKESVRAKILRAVENFS